MKKCSACGDSKALDAFYKSSATKDGLYAYCKPCAAAKKKISDKKLREANPEKHRARRRVHIATYRERHPDRVAEQYRRQTLRPFGITPAEYDLLLEGQGGVCAICGGTESGRRLAVDHDHETGAIRGLLCSPCNLSIGCLGDTVEGLMKAVSYLERERACN